jgi:hypothetical protein
MKYATAIREFLSALFGSKLVVELRAELAEARKERDYFRGQFERMQLVAIPHRIAPIEKRTVQPGGLTQTGGRKSWAMIQAENTQKQNEIAAKEAEKQKN